MTVDEVLVIGSVDEAKEFTIKAVEEVPPIPLWKFGIVLLMLACSGAGVYYTAKRRKKEGEGYGKK